MGFFRYVEPLARALEAEKWSLVQPLLSSSYIGFGTSSLNQVVFRVQSLKHLLSPDGLLA